MSYDEILKQIANSENISVEEVEREMKAAIKCSGLDCSVKEFIEMAANIAKDRLNIV